MYKVIFKNSRNRKLVGHLYATKSKSLIIMCHGFTSDKYSKGRFDKLAEAFHTVGFNVLAFDFSGCGESDDDVLTIEKEVDDLKSAIQFARKEGYEEIGLYGHSLGSYICLLSTSYAITTMVLSGALTDRMFYKWEDYFTKEQLRELDKSGHIVFPVKQEHRTSVIIDKSMLDGFSIVHQKSLLNNVKCPVLLIHGDGDEEERELLKGSQKGIDLLPKGSKVEIISGAPHNFMEHMDDVIRLSVRWFIQYLPR